MVGMYWTQTNEYVIYRRSYAVHTRTVSGCLRSVNREGYSALSGVWPRTEEAGSKRIVLCGRPHQKTTQHERSSPNSCPTWCSSYARKRSSSLHYDCLHQLRVCGALQRTHLRSRTDYGNIPSRNAAGGLIWLLPRYHHNNSARRAGSLIREGV